VNAVRRRRRGLGQLGWLVLVVLGLVAFGALLPSWVWTLAAGVAVLAGVYYLLGSTSGRRR
jgi:hypothetical protein